MNPTLNTRGRHALRWVLAVGLVFVLVVMMCLRETRHRASERWRSVLSNWEAGWLHTDVLNKYLVGGAEPGVIYAFADSSTDFNRGGNVFRGWEEYRVDARRSALLVRQERSFFGSSIEARLSGGEPAQIEAMRAIFAAVDVALVVEP